MENKFLNLSKQNKRLFLVVLFLFSTISLAAANFYPFATVLIIGVITALVLFAWKIEIGLYLMVLFLPVIDWNFYFRNLEIPFIDLLSGMIFCAFLLRVFYLLIFTEKRIRDFKAPLLIPFLYFFSIIIISSFLSQNIVSSLWYDLRWILFFYAVYIVLPFNIIKNQKILKNAIVFFVISGLLVAMMGVFSIFDQDWHSDFVRIKPISIGGIFPIGSNQNLLAEYLVAVIFFALALRFWNKSPRFGRFINLLIIFLGLVVIGTFSRAGWIVMIIQSIIYLTYKSKSWSKNIAAIFFISLALSPLLVYMVKLQSEYRIGVSSTENRLLLMEISWQAFKEKPFFGHGGGEYVNLVSDNIRFRAKYGEPLDSHGMWQKILAENGLLGVISFLVFSGMIFMVIFKAFKKNKQLMAVILPLVIGSGGVYVFEFFNTSYYKGKMWLPIAIALAAAHLADKKLLYGEKKD